MKVKFGTVWLITRGNCPHPQTEVVDILSARTSGDDMRKYVERLHNVAVLTLRERAELAAYIKPPKPVYPAEAHRARGRGIEIHCGHDPYFVARRAKNLLVEWGLPEGQEIVTWEPYGGGDPMRLSHSRNRTNG